MIAKTTFKRRRKAIREIVLPPAIIAELMHPIRGGGADRPGAGNAPAVAVVPRDGWRHVKAVMAVARISGDCAMPMGLRHSFAVAAFQASVLPHFVQRWLGYASVKMTAIYAEVSGAEEFGFAERMWEPAHPLSDDSRA